MNKTNRSQIDSKHHLMEFLAGNLELRQIVVEENIGLVLLIAKRFQNCDIEELLSIGVIGLIKALDTFDVSKGYEFSTYAKRCIENEILMFIRKENCRISRVISYEEIIYSDESGKNVRIIDTLIDDKSDYVIDYENKMSNIYITELINDLLQSLSERDREIIKLYFGFYNNIQYNQEQIANKLCLSQSCVSRIVNKCLKKLKLEIQCIDNDFLKPFVFTRKNN